MDCSRVRDMLEECFEGTLPNRKEEAMAEHLAGCQACAAELRQIERIAAALTAVPRAVPGGELLRTISARLAELPTPAARRALVRGWRRLGALAAACVAILAAVRYVVPLLWPEKPMLLGSLVVSAKAGVADVIEWIAGTARASVVLWEALREIGESLAVAGKAAAPTLGLYVAAELGILLAIVIVFHLGRSRIQARLTLLV